MLNATSSIEGGEAAMALEIQSIWYSYEVAPQSSFKVNIIIGVNTEDITETEL